MESHAHYSHARFEQSFRYLSFRDGNFSVGEGTRESLLQSLKECGVAAVVEPAIGLDSNEAVYRLSLAYPDFVFPAYGCHPTRVSLARWRDRKRIGEYAARTHGCVAIGETGLDYHHKRKDQHRWNQKRWFRYQIKLAFRLDKPLILHIRQAGKDALRILRRYRKYLRGGVVHCFCDDMDTARAYAEFGLYIGIGGMLMTEEHGETLSRVVREMPLECLLVETDAPYVLPDTDLFASDKQKGKVRNSSMTLFAVLERMAELKGMSVEETEERLFANAQKLFSIPDAKAAGAKDGKERE